MDLSTIKKPKASPNKPLNDYRREHTQLSTHHFEASRVQRGGMNHVGSSKHFESLQRNNETSFPKTLKSMSKREARGKPEKAGTLGRLLPEIAHAVKKVAKQDLNALLLDSIKKTRMLRVIVY